MDDRNIYTSYTVCKQVPYIDVSLPVSCLNVYSYNHNQTCFLSTNVVTVYNSSIPCFGWLTVRDTMIHVPLLLQMSQTVLLTVLALCSCWGSVDCANGMQLIVTTTYTHALEVAVYLQLRQTSHKHLGIGASCIARCFNGQIQEILHRKVCVYRFTSAVHIARK